MQGFLVCHKLYIRQIDGYLIVISGNPGCSSPSLLLSSVVLAGHSYVELSFYSSRAFLSPTAIGISHRLELPLSIPLYNILLSVIHISQRDLFWSDVDHKTFNFYMNESSIWSNLLIYFSNFRLTSNINYQLSTINKKQSWSLCRSSFYPTY